MSYSYDFSGNTIDNSSGGQSHFYDPPKKHQVTSTSLGVTFGYDANGNVTSRHVSGSSYTLTYDAQNRLTGVSGAASASVVCDGESQRVKATMGTTAGHVGNYYEVGSSTRTYYYLGRLRVAMRDGGALSFLLGDHLGSQAITADVWRQDGGAALQGLGREPLHERRDADQLPLHGAARREYNRAVLLRGALVRRVAWPLRPGGYHRAEPRKSAEPEPLLLRVQQPSQV